MMKHRSAMRLRQAAAVTTGDPVRVSVCHCGRMQAPHRRRLQLERDLRCGRRRGDGPAQLCATSERASAADAAFAGSATSSSFTRSAAARPDLDPRRRLRRCGFPGPVVEVYQESAAPAAVARRSRSERSGRDALELQPRQPRVEAAACRSALSWLPSSTIRPWSITMIRSAARTVARRWAMTSVVRPSISRSSASCTSRSLSASSARGRLVEQQDRRIAQQRAGDGDALALAARQARAAFAEEGVEPLRAACAGIRRHWRPRRRPRSRRRSRPSGRSADCRAPRRRRSRVSCGTIAMRRADRRPDRRRQRRRRRVGSRPPRGS